MVESLKNNLDFQKVYKSGSSYADRYMVMYILENGRDTNRYGISVSKKVGNSIVRHRLKRIVRESVRLNSDKVRSGYDIVMIVRKALVGCKYDKAEKSFIHLCSLQGLLFNKEKTGEEGSN